MPSEHVGSPYWRVNPVVRGTGSHNVAIDDVVVSADLVTPPPPESPRID